MNYLQVNNNKQDLHDFHFNPERSEEEKVKIESYCKRFK